MQHWGYQDDFKVNMSPENIGNMPEYLKRTKQQNYIDKNCDGTCTHLYIHV